MEIKYGVRRRKVWECGVGVMSKTDERQLLSFGLPETPVVWNWGLAGSAWAGGSWLPQDTALVRDLTISRQKSYRP